MTCLLFLFSCLCYLQNKIQSERVAFQTLCFEPLPDSLAFSYNFYTYEALWISYVPLFMPAFTGRKQGNVVIVFLKLSDEEIIFKWNKWNMISVLDFRTDSLVK